MTCDKIKYDTYKAAIGAIIGISKRDKQKMAAYKCPDCGGYHLRTIRKNTMQQTKKERYAFDLDKIPKPVQPQRYAKSSKINNSVKLEPQRLLTKQQAEILKSIIENKSA